MKRVLGLIGLIGLAGLIGLTGAMVAMKLQHTGQVADTVRVEVVDTIPYYQPVPKDSVVVRYVTRVMAVGSGENATGMHVDSTGAGEGDSSTVVIPITQKRYETEAYRAYVSGYEPNLDSIFIHQKTVTQTVTLSATPKGTLKDRVGFCLSVGAGYGTIHKQADVFIGCGLYLRLW